MQDNYNFNPTQITDENKRNHNKNHQKTIWAWFFGGVSAIAISVSLFYGIKYKQITKAQLTSEDYYKNQSIANCRRSMYNILDGLQNTDANIGKLLVSQDKNFISKILTETNGIAMSCVTDVSYLPIQVDIANGCAKYFNQLGDYCNALTKSVADKQNLTEEQKNSLKDLRRVGNKLKNSINNAVNNDDSLVFESTKGNYTFQLVLDDIDQNLFDYPQLVYDGPFSDSVTQKTFDRPKLSIDEVKAKLTQTFRDYALDNLQFVSKANGKAFVYYFDLTLNGQKYTLATATDGTVAELTQNQSQSSEVNQTSNVDFHNEEKCRQIATDMAKALDYDVVPMWVSEPIDGRVYVNMISRQDEVSLYPDMVKMAVDTSSGQV
ncbi:MAG: germination protein YpeB, partial [Clostridia bacterium]|nr:germination protein YpeB [Clostridia bacterium]